MLIFSLHSHRAIWVWDAQMECQGIAGHFNGEGHGEETCMLAIREAAFKILDKTKDSRVFSELTINRIKNKLQN